jgi:hypothetical protein
MNWPLLLGVLLVASPVVVKDTCGAENPKETCRNICKLKMKKKVQYVESLGTSGDSHRVCACYTERVIITYDESQDDQRKLQPEEN